jgi:hypothetical protein
MRPDNSLPLNEKNVTKSPETEANFKVANNWVNIFEAKCSNIITYLVGGAGVSIGSTIIFEFTFTLLPNPERST